MAKTRATQRPMPPQHLGQFADKDTIINFAPAPDVLTWAKREILTEGGSLFNPDHQHLEDADVQFLWAAGGFTKQMNRVVGQCELVTFRCGPWQKGRQEQQMREWFGSVPEFLITLDASYAAQCSDAEFCALVEHELYHIGHEHDQAGQPKFWSHGTPKLAIRGHDVEEFVGIVRRYGATGRAAELVAAAGKRPEVSGINIARACGTCQLRAA